MKINVQMITNSSEKTTIKTTHKGKYNELQSIEFRKYIPEDSSAKWK